VPTSIYRTKDGKRVPGTTTIIGRFKESGGLIHWAWELGIDGKDYRQARDAAADAGTIAHLMIERFLHDEDPYTVDGPNELVELAAKGLEAFMLWWESTKVEVEATEIALVSEEYRFGGTPDAIGCIGSALALLDWKTGNHVYAEHIIQLSCYRHLYEHNNPGKKLTRFELLRFGKEYGDFHHHSWPIEVIDLAWESFKHMRQLYDLDKKIKKVVG
jgi:hypothetical protein